MTLPLASTGEAPIPNGLLNGPSGRVLAESHLHGLLGTEELGQQCPLTGAATENALAVVAHSDAALPLVPRETPVAYLPLCVGAPAPADIMVVSALSGGGHDPGSGPLPADLPIVTVKDQNAFAEEQRGPIDDFVRIAGRHRGPGEEAEQCRSRQSRCCRCRW